jgi:integrase
MSRNAGKGWRGLLSIHTREPPPRRLRVERGIYVNPSTGGFEITYVDGSGRLRWKMVPGGLGNARSARVEAKRLRLAFATVAEEWLTKQTHLRPRTYEGYARALRRHVFPRIGQYPIANVDEEAVANLVRELDAQGLSGWTIRGVLIPLGRVLRYAVRQKLAPYNAVSRLERSERPHVVRREKRILTTDEIETLLRATPKGYQPIITTAVFTGLRLSELLGLWWGDVDLDSGVLTVRRQLDRTGSYTEPKTPRSARTVVLTPSLVTLLRQHKRGSPRTGPGDVVFATETGRPMYYRNVTRRGLAVGIDRAGLNRDGQPRLRFHDLRHTYASLLIAQGLNVVFVSRQLGHAFPSFTLNTYGGVFDRVEHARRAVEGLEVVFPRSLGKD